MKTIKIFIFSLFIFGNTYAQQSNQNQDSSNTIKDQFIDLYKKSGSYQVYKVIKKDKFLVLQKNVLDSITEFKKEVALSQQKINSHQKTVATLESKISTLDNNLSVALDKENTISLFGLQLSKAGYNTLLWGIISALLLGLIFFIYKFKNSNYSTKEAKSALLETEQELEQFRKKTIVKEQQLRRQLQDEINKQRGV